MGKIEQKLNELFSYMQDFMNKNGYAPTVRDICRDLSIKSTATAHYYLNKLTEKGLINKDNDKKRAISIKKRAEFIEVPLVGTVTAGTPILAVENLEDYYPLPKEFESGETLFMLTVKGDSMINAGILNGDKIIVKKTDYAENGDIVVALIEDSATVKRFYKKDGKIVLHPENDNMQDIVLEDASIIGIVQGLTRKF